MSFPVTGSSSTSIRDPRCSQLARQHQGPARDRVSEREAQPAEFGHGSSPTIRASRALRAGHRLFRLLQLQPNSGRIEIPREPPALPVCIRKLSRLYTYLQGISKNRAGKLR